MPINVLSGIRCCVNEYSFWFNSRVHIFCVNKNIYIYRIWIISDELIAYMEAVAKEAPKLPFLLYDIDFVSGITCEYDTPSIIWLHGNPCALLALCEGNPPVTGGFPSQRANNAELCYFLCCWPWWTVDQTVGLTMICDVITMATS